MSSIGLDKIKRYAEEIREKLGVDKTDQNEKELEEIITKIHFNGVKGGKSVASDLLQQAIRLLEK